MTALSSLWLPLLLAIMLVFIASSVIHRAMPWHKKATLDAVIYAALSGVASIPTSTSCNVDRARIVCALVFPSATDIHLLPVLEIVECAKATSSANWAARRVARISCLRKNSRCPMRKD